MICLAGLAPLKPGPEAYLQVTEDLGCDAAEVMFFDDTLKNVEAASALGFRAFHTCGVDELRACVHSQLGEYSPL